MGRTGALACASLALSLLAGCASLRQTSSDPTAAAEVWPMTLATARGRASIGDFDGADSALAQFRRQYPGASEAVETSYWRGLFKLDPTNRAASIPAAVASLDAYLADPHPREHVSEATTLRHVAGELDGLTKLAANALAQATEAKANAASATAAAADAIAARDAAARVLDVPPNAAVADEVKRLKDELTKANSELERIRKRLVQPPKP